MGDPRFSAGLVLGGCRASLRHGQVQPLDRREAKHRARVGRRPSVLMRKFKVFVNGKNYWVKLDGERRRFGFYTTRFVEAASPEEAEERAVQLLREDAALTSAILNEASDPPMLYVEEIVELVSFDGVKPPGTGRAWYREEDDA